MNDKSINAIVVIYNGSPVTPNDASIPMNIAQLLRNYGFIEDTDNVTVIAKDANGISKALLRDDVEDFGGPRIIAINKPVDARVRDATIEAVKLIGKMFAESLIVGKNTSNYGPLMRDLLMHGEDTIIRSAVKVIAESNASIPKRLFKEYNITPSAIETIRDVNNTLL